MSAHGPPAAPSHNALRTLRRLALAGSTVGSFCAVAAITFDVHRRVTVAERIVESKRAIQTSAPRYDATSAARRLSRMMDAAEAGEFVSLEAWREEERKARKSRLGMESDSKPPNGKPPRAALKRNGTQFETARPYADDVLSNEVIDFVTELERERIIPQRKDGYQIPSSRPPPPSLASQQIAQSPNWESATATEDSRSELRSEEQPTLHEHMKALISQRKYIDAAQAFLDAHPASIKGISTERRELAVAAFYLNCRKGNVFVARSVFERLEDVDHVSPTMWKILIVTLAQRGCIESAASVFVRHRTEFHLPGILLDVVLRCLLESRRLTSAKWLILRNLSKDKDGGLCAAYLTGLWKKTRSIELLNLQFVKIVTMLRRLKKRLTAKHLNPMLKAYVESGKFAEAEAFVREMTTTHQIKPLCWTKGYIVYGKALQCDWTAVDEGLEEMHVLGLTKEKTDFTRVFDRIFLEYWPSHTSDQIRDFLYRHIDRFNVTPDDVLYQHILEALVEKGNENIVSEFVDMGRERGWEIKINVKEYMETLHRRRSALEKSPVGFWQMLKNAREDMMRSNASQQLIGYDRDAFAEILPQMLVDGADFQEQWRDRTLNEVTSPFRAADRYQKLQKAMAHYMHSGKMAAALESFQHAKDHGHHIKAPEAELALIATLLEHGLVETQARLDDSWAQLLPIFFRQIRTMDPASEAEALKMAIFRFYKLCWLRKDLVVKHHIAASTARRLISSGNPAMAIDLLVTVYTSKYGRLKSFDGVCMKMFLRAFAAKKHLFGIRWCILTALARGSALSSDFVVELERVLPIVRREVSLQKKRQELDWLDSALLAVRRKSQGSSKFKKIKGNPQLKKSLRRELKAQKSWQSIWKNQFFKELVGKWDEEYELDRVMGRIDTDKDSILARWSEEARHPPIALHIAVPAIPLKFFSATTMATATANGHTLKPSDAAELRRRVHHDADVVIVGAGVLGCALAVALGRQGRSVLLLEQSLKEPDRIVGELLQPGGVSALEQLGLRDCLEGIEAIPTEGYYVSYLGKPVTIPYPIQSPGAPRPEGRSFHHGRFVNKLREAARACPNVTIVETKVTDLITFSQTKQVLGVECVTKEHKDCYFGQVTVVADGYASKFRKQYHPYTPKVRSKFWGLELIDAELPQPHYGHVLLNPESPPILVYQIGTHETRILCDIPENLPSASVKNGGVKGHLRNTVLPSLPKSIQPSFAAALDKNQLRSMPNSFLPSATNKTPGLIVLGDALNMRHPLTGGGMTVALNDVVILRDLLSPEKVPKLSDSALVLKQLSTFHWRRKMGASVINVLAQALYSLFAADDDNLKALQRGCFQYFEMGMYNQPVSLLGGMLKKPQVLFAHFFTVAFLSLWMMIRESPIYKLPMALVRCVFVFWTACVVILPYMMIEAFC
ncbi:squalene epoxidase-domain-containing protein [Aspergillus venezuelensis]